MVWMGWVIELGLEVEITLIGLWRGKCVWISVTGWRNLWSCGCLGGVMVAYVRALQLTQNGTVADVPPDHQSDLGLK